LGDCRRLIKDPHQINIPLAWNIKFWIKDDKIIRYHGSGRFLNLLIQYGQIVIKRNKKEEIDHYMSALQNLGIIPPETYIKPPE
jgi:hypothetical protein